MRVSKHIVRKGWPWLCSRFMGLALLLLPALTGCAGAVFRKRLQGTKVTGVAETTRLLNAPRTEPLTRRKGPWPITERAAAC